VFLIIGSLGFLTELQRRLPVYFKDKNSFKILVSIAQIIIIVFSVFLLASLTSLLDVGMLNIGRNALLIGFFGGLSQLLFSIITSETRSRQLLIRFSNEILIKNIISFAAGVSMAFYFNDGVWIFLAESIVTVIVAVILFGRLSPEFKVYGCSRILNTALLELKQLNWVSILSMFAIGLLAFAMQNGERYIARSILPIHNFAILSFGLIIPNIANTIQSIFNSSIFTNQVLRFDEYGRAAVIIYSIKMSLIFAAFFAFLSVPMYFVAKEAISIYYPKYIEILPYLPVIFLAFVVRSSDFISNIYIIINKPQYIVIIQIMYILLLFIVSLTVSRNSMDMTTPLYYFVLNFINAFIPVLIILLTIRMRK